MTRDAHQLSHDLRIGLAVEAVIGWASAAEHVEQRAMNRALPCTVGEQDGAVNVKENELHIRVSKSPLMMLAAPTPCHGVGDSPSTSQATSTAMSG